jgi:hypothetical protein
MVSGMSTREQKLMRAERAIKRLAKLAMDIDINPEDLAEWMKQGDKLGECNAVDIAFLAEWLGLVEEEGDIRAFEHAKPRPACAVCGKDAHKFDVRRHTQYCSDKCKQKAYRMRNGSHCKKGIET